jgi:hypothetical protein
LVNGANIKRLDIFVPLEKDTESSNEVIFLSLPLARLAE